MRFDQPNRGTAAAASLANPAYTNAIIHSCAAIIVAFSALALASAAVPTIAAANPPIGAYAAPRTPCTRLRDNASDMHELLSFRLLRVDTRC